MGARRPKKPTPDSGNRPPGTSVRKTGWLVAAAAFTLLFLYLVSPLLLKSAEPRWDARDQFYPAFTYLSDAMNEGRWPLWDPYTNCGYPYHAEPDHPTLNPVALLLAALGSDTWGGFVAFWTIHWLAAGLGMFLLVRHLAGTPAGAFAAAMTYAFSGFFVSHAEHTPYICVAAWLPFIVFLGDKAVEGRRWSCALLAGAATGLSTLGGYPALTTFNGLFLALWLTFRHVIRPVPGPVADPAGGSTGKRALLVLSVLAIVASISLLVWSPVLASFFLEGAGYTDRVDSFGIGRMLGAPFTAACHASIFSPYATILGREWLGNDISMADGYPGILAFPLAIAWLLTADGRKRGWWLPVLFLFAWLISIGAPAGFRYFMYYVFPPIRFMNYAAPYRLYWIFTLAVGVGMGLSALGKDRDAARGAFGPFLVWCGVSAAACVAISLFLSSHGVDVARNAVPLFLPLAPLAVATFLAFRLRAASGAAPPVIPALLALLVAFDLGAHLTINSEVAWVNRDSIATAERFHVRSTRIDGEPGPRHPPMHFGVFNVQQIIKEPVVLGSVSLKSKGFDERLCKSRHWSVLASPIRFWLSPVAERAVSEEALLASLSGTGAGDAIPVFMEDPGALPPGRIVPGSYGSARVTAYAPERVEIAVEVPGGAPAVLASTERFTPGWHATVDGIPATALTINRYFRGVIVPAGRHAVLWRYEPAYWTPLVALSGFALLAVAVASFLLARREGRRAAVQQA